MLVDLSHFVVVGVVHLSAGVVDLSAGIVHLLSGFLSAVLEHVCLSPAIYIHIIIHRSLTSMAKLTDFLGDNDETIKLKE